MLKMTKHRLKEKFFQSRVWFFSIEEVFDFQMFNCVQLAKHCGEFDFDQLPSPVQINQMTEVLLSSINYW